MARNSGRGSYAYKTSEDDALQQLPQALRDRLFFGPFNWSAAWTLNEYKRQLKKWPPSLAIAKVIDILDGGDSEMIRKRPQRNAPLSTALACGVAPLMR